MADLILGLPIFVSMMSVFGLMFYVDYTEDKLRKEYARTKRNG